MSFPNLSDLPPWLGGVLALVAGLLSIAYSLVQVWSAIGKLRREIKDLPEKVEARVSGELQLYFRDVLQVAFRDVLKVQTYRLAQHNMSVQSECKLRYHHHEGQEFDEPFIAAELKLTNEGQEPLDLLSCLVAGRELSNHESQGIGRHGLEVNWEALRHYYWNDHWRRPRVAAHGAELFQGLSTAGSLFKVRSQLVRLDPKETEELLRIDAVTDPDALLAQGHLHLIYKIFVAVVSPARDGQPLTNEQHRRWRSVQYTLSALNSLPFRLALDAEEIDTREDLHASDPIGLLTDQTEWRCFLLHQWEFDQLPGKGPPGLTDSYSAERERGGVATVDQVSLSIDERSLYSLRQLDDARLARVRAECRQKLDIMVRAWRDLLHTIKHCLEPEVGWSNLVKEDGYRERWQALVKEGYLFATPDGDSRIGTAVEAKDVDILTYERFAIRTKYMLCAINVDIDLEHLHAEQGHHERSHGGVAGGSGSGQ